MADMLYTLNSHGVLQLFILLKCHELKTVHFKNFLILISMKSIFKVALSLLLALILVPGCQKEDSGPQDIAALPNAKIKRILIFPGIEATSPGYIVSEYEYDSLDRLIRINHPMYDDGIVSGISDYDIYSYNDKGLLWKISSYNYNAAPGVGYLNRLNTYYYYSRYGKITKVSRGYGDSPESAGYDLYSYKNGHLDKIEKYTPADTLESYTRYEYNNSSDPVKESVYSWNGELLLYTRHTYTDALQQLSEVYSTFPEDFMIRKIERTFDDNGNLDILLSKELAPWSSMMSYKMKYEYY